jgi:hypothetical protein
MTVCIDYHKKFSSGIKRAKKHRNVVLKGNRKLFTVLQLITKESDDIYNKNVFFYIFSLFSLFSFSLSWIIFLRIQQYLIDNGQ